MGWKEDLADILKKPVLRDVPMSRYTSIGVGGPAEMMVFPETYDELRQVLALARRSGVPLVILGEGTNLLVKDGGIRGIILNLSSVCSVLTFDNGIVRAGSAVTLPRISWEAIQRGLSGLEFALGIPGSLGGALYMNAGAYGSTIGNLMREVTTMDLHGHIRVRAREELLFSYRRSSFQDEETVILEGVLQLQEGSRDSIMQQAEELLKKRRLRHPTLPSAGSVFRNPTGEPAGYLIEQAGAKGITLGGAQVSPRHGNFIVNTGGATAADILKLIEKVKNMVKEHFAVDLELEIKVIGDNGVK